MTLWFKLAGMRVLGNSFCALDFAFKSAECALLTQSLIYHGCVFLETARVIIFFLVIQNLEKKVRKCLFIKSTEIAALRFLGIASRFDIFFRVSKFRPKSCKILLFQIYWKCFAKLWFKLPEVRFLGNVFRTKLFLVVQNLDRRVTRCLVCFLTSWKCPASSRFNSADLHFHRKQYALQNFFWWYNIGTKSYKMRWNFF